MRYTLLLFFFGYSLYSYSQTISFNSETKVYEYSEVVEFESSISETLEQMYFTMKELNYSNLEKTETDITGNNFFFHVITGTALEVRYSVIILFRDGRYKLTVNNFTLYQAGHGTMRMEGVRKKARDKWVQIVNDKLPEILIQLKQKPDW